MNKNLPYNRADRVADEIFRLVSETLISELADPRLSGVQITRVRVTQDLRIARIFFYFGDGSRDNEKRAQSGFESCAGFLKRKLARELNLKYTPEMQFFYDDAIDLTNKIESLFEGGRSNEPQS